MSSIASRRNATQDDGALVQMRQRAVSGPVAAEYTGIEGEVRLRRCLTCGIMFVKCSTGSYGIAESGLIIL